MAAIDRIKLASDISFIQDWMIKIGETDEVVIKETIDMMRTNPAYRIFIVDYAKGEKIV